MVKIAKCRDISAHAPRVTRTVLGTKPGTVPPFRPVELVHLSAGWTPAGSMMRWDEERWAVQFEVDGATHGRRFKTEAEARALFDRWST